MILVDIQGGEPLFWHQLSYQIDRLGRGQRSDTWDTEKQIRLSKTQEQKLGEPPQDQGRQWTVGRGE